MINAIKRFFGIFVGKKIDKKLHVLVVEDNEVDRRIVCKIVSKQGHDVTEAENGKEGLEIVKLKKPDLILMDCEMPELNGIEMCRAIKDSVETSDIPVIFLTGHGTPQNIVECFGVNAENLLTKPINAKLLVEQIEMISSAE